MRYKSVVSGLRAETHLAGRFRTCTLRERMGHYFTPGLSITVVDGGRIAWSKGFGYGNLGAREMVDEETMFLAGSISKPVFALGVLKLAEAGEIDLDRDVNDYLKRWKIPASRGWRPRITMRQLLSHTAGLTVQGFPGYRKSDRVPGTVQILKGVPPANTEPVLPNILPGTMMRYSGGGITVAQLAVEDAMKAPFPELMRELLFEPLGMRNSTYDQRPRKTQRRIAHGYPWYNRVIPGGYHIYPEMAAAGLWSTGLDLARLMIEVQKGFAGEPSFFSTGLVREMLTPQKMAKNIGFGFFLEGDGDAARFYHGGWDEGFVAKFVSYKKGGKGAVVMLNSNSGNPMIEEILRSVAAEYGWPGYTCALPASANRSPGPLAGHCGDYVSETGLLFRVRARGGRLALEAEGQPPVEILPESSGTFFAEALNLKVRFETGRGKSPGALFVIQGGVEIKAARKSS